MISVGVSSAEPVVNQTGQSQSNPDKLQALAVSGLRVLAQNVLSTPVAQPSEPWKQSEPAHDGNGGEINRFPSLFPPAPLTARTTQQEASPMIEQQDDEEERYDAQADLSVSVGAPSAPSVGAFTTPTLSSSVGAPPSRIAESAADPHAVSAVSQPLILPLDMDVAVNISPWGPRSQL